MPSLTQHAQSIDQRSSQSHTRAREKPHPPQGAANPASRSDAGLGGCERVALPLSHATRSFSPPLTQHARVLQQARR